MSTNLSANDFRDPLLRVLGNLAGFQAGVQVLATDTYNPVMAILGISDVNEYGDNEASGGTPQVIKWIQWANKKARRHELTTAPPKTRGKWTLTDAGVLEARKLADAAGDVASPVTTLPVATPQTNVVSMAMATPAASVVVPTKVTPAAALAPVVMLHPSTYHPDAYIRSLAFEATGCFDKYSSHGAAACATCPIVADCRNKQMSVFHRLALDLQAADLKAKPAAKADKKVKSKTKPATRSKFANIDFSTVDAILCKFDDARCEACGEVIKLNERCRWVEEIPGTDDGGLFHIACSGGE